MNFYKIHHPLTVHFLVDNHGLEPRRRPLTFIPSYLNFLFFLTPTLRGEYRSRTDDLLLAKQAL
jgi:hypothetical protein